MNNVSAAFDTIDAPVLLKTMNDCLEIFGSALTWFSSYMSDRTQCTQIGTDTSDERPLRYGVLQGSVLRPLLFTVYMEPMQDMLKRHAVEYHKFSDDLQIYTSYYPHVPDDRERQRLCDCINEIKCWMVQRKLKLNDEKTEFMVALSPRVLRKFGLPKNLVVRGATIKPVVSVRNLEARFDTHIRIMLLLYQIHQALHNEACLSLIGMHVRTFIDIIFLWTLTIVVEDFICFSVMTF